jgi:hypothetical protein
MYCHDMVLLLIKSLHQARIKHLEGSMSSLYDELSDKLKKDPRRTKMGGARYDLGLMLFNARDSLRDLWQAAEAEVSNEMREGYQPSSPLEAAVEKLRPIFGEKCRS